MFGQTISGAPSSGGGSFAFGGHATPGSEGGGSFESFGFGSPSSNGPSFAHGPGQSFPGFRPNPAATFNNGTPMAREQSGPAFGVSTTSSSGGGSSSVRFEFPGCAPFAALQNVVGAAPTPAFATIFNPGSESAPVLALWTSELGGGGITFWTPAPMPAFGKAPQAAISPDGASAGNSLGLQPEAAPIFSRT